MKKSLLVLILAGCAGWFVYRAMREAPPGNQTALEAQRRKLIKDAQFEELLRIREAVLKQDREKLVRPAPPGFKPEAEGRKIRLTLELEKTTIKMGERLWYQLGVQNVGTEPLWFTDKFFKDGNWGTGNISKWGYYIKGPDRKEDRIDTGPFGDPVDDRITMKDIVQPVEFPQGMTKNEKMDYLARRYKIREAREGLEIELQPGETIVTAPWSLHGREARGPFRELTTYHKFKRPGKYAFRVVFDDPPHPEPTEVEFKSYAEIGWSRERLIADRKEFNAKRLGVISSPTVEFEIVR